MDHSDGVEGSDMGSPASKEDNMDDPWTIDIEEEGILRVRAPLVPLIDDKDGYVVLGRNGSAHKKWRRKGLLEIGAVGEHQDTGVDLFGKKVFLDAAFPHIIFICGKRGSGKSYTLGIFAEELIRSSIGVGVVMIDPIGIFWSMKNENRSKKEKEILKRWGLEPHSFPEVKVLVPEGSLGETTSSIDGIFSISVSEMETEDWCQVFDVTRFKTQGLLIGSVIDQIRKGYDSVNEGRIVHVSGRRNLYSIGDIIQCIETSITITSKTGGFTPQTRRSIIARFNAASAWGVFSVEGTPLKEVSSSNRVTILDVSDPRLGDEKRSLITGIVARKILSARIHSARMEEREDYDELDQDIIPVTWLLIDEAHIILPHKGQTPATEALVEYAKQGRRPGCALVLATQRPASTSDEILSQVDLLIGHNLALEDDMTALRRRVPAKLPAEFANSDFIRAIPVGTGIMADQRTQQRSFLLKIRPRFSHHAGSSAMPKAFIERKVEHIQKVPISGDYTISEGRSDVSRPTAIQRSDGSGSTIRKGIMAKGPKDVLETHPTVHIEKGKVILVTDQSKEVMVQLLDSLPADRNAVLFSRMPPDLYPVGTALEIKKRFWLSSTPGDDNIPPTSLQDISMESGSFLSGSKQRIILLDGLDYIVANNGKEPVKRLLEILHEKVIVNEGNLIMRADLGMDKDTIAMIASEADIRIGSLEDMIDPGSSKDEIGVKVEIDEVKPEHEGGLLKEDLRWMCDVLGLSKDGNEGKLLERILDHEEELIKTEDDRSINKEDRIQDLVDTTKEAREENEKLVRKIDELEDKLKKDKSKGKTGRKTSVRGMVLKWDDESNKKMKRKSDRKLKELISEVENMKKEVQLIPYHRDDIRDQALIKILERMEADRKENIDRLDLMGSILRSELKEMKERMDIHEKKDETIDVRARSIKKVQRKKEPVGPQKALPPVEAERKHNKMKKKVLKRGKQAVAVIPIIGSKTASESAKKTIKRSLLRGPKENLEEIVPAYIPLYRFLLGYKGSLFRDQKEGDLFIDAISGEIVIGSRIGLDRSKGLLKLLKMTDIEAKVYGAVNHRKREDLTIARRAKLALKDVRRSLTSLQKKGIVDRTSLEGNVNLFFLSDDMDIPKKPWSKDPNIHPDWVEGLEEPFIKPFITRKDGEKLIGILSDDLTILQLDEIMYPYYIAKIAGKGRIRLVAVDGVSGRVDNAMTPFLKEIMDSPDMAL